MAEREDGRSYLGGLLKDTIDSAVGSSDKTKKIVANKKALDKAANKKAKTGKSGVVVIPTDTNATDSNSSAKVSEFENKKNASVGKKNKNAANQTFKEWKAAQENNSTK